MFCIGAVGLLVRRNALIMFMCVELMLNAVNLTFVTFARMLDDIGGQVFVFFTLVVAAAEVVGRPGPDRVHLPAPPGRHRRRRQPAAGLAACTKPPHHSLDLAWLIPAFPLAGFVILFLGRRQLKEPVRAGSPPLMMAGSFVTAVRRSSPSCLSLDEHERQVDLKGFDWIRAGGFSVALRPAGRPAVDHDGPVRHRRRRPHPPVLDRLHARPGAVHPLLHLPEPVRLLDARPGPGRATTSSLSSAGRASGCAPTC